MAHLSQRKDQFWYIINSKSIIYSYFPVFTNVFFSVKLCCLGYHVPFSCHVSLGSFWLGQFSKLLLLLKIMTVLRRTDQVFCRMFLNWVCLCFFSLSTLIVFWVEEDQRVKVFFLSYCIKGTFYQHNLSLLILTLTTGWGSIWQASMVNLLFSSPFPYGCSLGENHYTQPVHKGTEVMFHLFENRVSTLNNWNQTEKDICLLLQLFTF